jgi:hypothetical protein
MGRGRHPRSEYKYGGLCGQALETVENAVIDLEKLQKAATTPNPTFVEGDRLVEKFKKPHDELLF